MGSNATVPRKVSRRDFWAFFPRALGRTRLTQHAVALREQHINFHSLFSGSFSRQYLWQNKASVHKFSLKRVARYVWQIIFLHLFSGPALISLLLSSPSSLWDGRGREKDKVPAMSEASIKLLRITRESAGVWNLTNFICWLEYKICLCLGQGAMSYLSSRRITRNKFKATNMS
jgi:hypothetical protein